MKKIVLPIAVILLTLAGCGGKAISIEEAAPLIPEQMIYDRSEDKFEDNFVDGEALSDSFDELEDSFERSFTTGLLTGSSELSEDQAEAITEELQHEVRQQATYKVEAKKSSDIYHVTYQVKGLDFADIMKQTTSQLTKEMLANKELAKDDNQLRRAVLDILRSTIKNAKVKTEAVNVMLEMKEEKGKWLVVSGQSEQLNSLFTAFYAGVSNQQTLEEELQNAVKEVTQEVQDQLK